MNKQKQLKKALVKHGAVYGGVVAGFTALYFGTGAFLASTLTDKNDADKALSTDQSQVTSLTTQLDKSSIAERRFAETQSQRISFDFSANTEALKDWLKNAIAQYRLSNSFKLSLTADKPTSIKELSGTSYEAIEHPGMKVEFSSISDTHAFSFIDDFAKNAPGFIVVETLSMKRTNDIDKNTINTLRTGGTPFLVETKMTFNWIGLAEKEKDKDKDKDKKTPDAGGKK